MAGFFRDVFAAGKEGWGEGKANVAQQQAGVAAQQQARAAALDAQIRAASRDEVFTVALGAVYRENYLLELATAKSDARPPAHLYLAAVPEDEVISVRRYLKRDFDAVDPSSVTAALETLWDRLADADDREVEALWITRACWVGPAAAGTGLIEPGYALALTGPFRRRAQAVFAGWADFGRAFLAGERLSPASNTLGRRALTGRVEELLRTPGSPWREWPWPIADAPVG